MSHNPKSRARHISKALRGIKLKDIRRGWIVVKSRQAFRLEEKARDVTKDFNDIDGRLL